MALCSPTEVKALALSGKLTDADYQAIINLKSKEIASKTGGDEDQSSNDSLNSACIYASAAQVLRNMQINGELAASKKLGSDSISNSIESVIKSYEDQAEFHIKKYRCSGFSIIYNRVGPGTVDPEPGTTQVWPSGRFG